MGLGLDDISADEQQLIAAEVAAEHVIIRDEVAQESARLNARDEFFVGEILAGRMQPTRSFLATVPQ